VESGEWGTASAQRKRLSTLHSSLFTLHSSLCKQHLPRLINPALGNQQACDAVQGDTVVTLRRVQEHEQRTLGVAGGEFDFEVVGPECAVELWVGAIEHGEHWHVG
jgi:hypothetical protein